MAKSRISVGVDDATGQPASAPEGPYITDEDDGTTPRGKRRADRAAPARRRAQADAPSPRDAPDLAARRKGPAQP
jgi:hypothetical protein